MPITERTTHLVSFFFELTPLQLESRVSDLDSEVLRLTKELKVGWDWFTWFCSPANAFLCYVAC